MVNLLMRCYNFLLTCVRHTFFILIRDNITLAATCAEGLLFITVYLFSSLFQEHVFYDDFSYMLHPCMCMHFSMLLPSLIHEALPNAMDIGAMTTITGAATSNGTALIGALMEEMRAALMKIGACFRCRKTGHMSRDCPLKNQGSQQTQTQQQKTYTPKDVHMNIRSMTTEQRKELMEMLTTDLGF